MTAGAYGCAVGGGGSAGEPNKATDPYCTVGGGIANVAGDDDGDFSIDDADSATVSGGWGNAASNCCATVGGGEENTASGDTSTIGGGMSNAAAGDAAVIAGGYNNEAKDAYDTIGGGASNVAGHDTEDGSHATVGGGSGNTASGQYATVGGGVENTASAAGATVAGGGSPGSGNTASSPKATVGGGWKNTAGGNASTVAGGYNNTATSSWAVVGGGWTNSATALYATVAGGGSNEAGASHATVPGGFDNNADGSYSFAAGRRAKANHNGAFVWADSTDADFASTGSDQFRARSTGGVYLDVDTDGGGLDIRPRTNSPNLLAGHSSNVMVATVDGGVISGGGNSSWWNKVTDHYGTVGGGIGNEAGDNAGTVDDAEYATVAGGYRNRASGEHATVAGGTTNIASGGAAGICSGRMNTADGMRAFVGAGFENDASGNYSAIPGGHYNAAAGDYSLAAGRRAKANHDGCFVWADSTNADFGSATANTFLIRAGGGVGIGLNSPNEALHVSGNIKSNGTLISGSSVIVDGNNNRITSTGDLDIHVSTGRALRIESHFDTPNLIGGDSVNTVTAGVRGATIGGGGHTGGTNTVTDNFGTVAGGVENQAGDGAGTSVDAGQATVGGGYQNTASGLNSVVGGGYDNTASGSQAMVPGGASNTAAGDYSFAAGRRAKANHEGCFVWADSSDEDFTSSVANRFYGRATNGYFLYTATSKSAGVYVSGGGGSWNSLSDRTKKENFTAVDTKDVLAKLVAVPITNWNYKTQDDGIRHMSPVAQDLYAAFGLGDSETAITTIDGIGISMAAIQGLHQVVEEKDARIRSLENELTEVKEQFRRLRDAVESLTSGAEEN
ncbi:MAG: tail fiber domain-containing protein [Planctomycetota bacterium]